MKKMIFAAAASVAAAAFVSLTPAAALAEPWPGSCSSGFGWQTDYTWAQCNSGGGQVRAIAKCSSGLSTKTVYGPWVGIGKQSSAHCPVDYRKAVDHNFGIRQ
ncbi:MULTISPECIES: hypothetical protein [unclassified Streptosporangium]|uniref:hypothetical protein n=1 Tax=unclassified Streptosporangium TaxID=2632669 RepID=UPI002E282A45|nr:MULTISPECIES: hypothetical protein [unclassified Streptosporangium]